MRIRDWSSDVCSSDLLESARKRAEEEAARELELAREREAAEARARAEAAERAPDVDSPAAADIANAEPDAVLPPPSVDAARAPRRDDAKARHKPHRAAPRRENEDSGRFAGQLPLRSEEHTSELQSLMRN